MGVFSKTASTHEGLPVVANASLRRKVSSFLPICVAIVVLVEIAFLGRLDNPSLLDALTSFFGKLSSPTKPSSGSNVGSGTERCEEWLEREDSVSYSRNFSKDPIFISGGDKDFESCSVDCAIAMNSNKTPDAAFGLLGHQPGTLRILRSMESARYFIQNNIAHARRWEGFWYRDDN